MGGFGFGGARRVGGGLVGSGREGMRAGAGEGSCWAAEAVGR